MASGKGTYLANKNLDLALGASAFTAPVTVYLALFSVAPTAAGGGTEATGTGYARKAITNNSTNFPAASAGSKSNGVDFAFAAAGGDWSAAANQVAFAIFDAASAGNLLYFGLLTAKPVLSGDTPTFPAGTLVVTEA